MIRHYRSFIAAIASAIMAIVAFSSDFLCKLAKLASPDLTPQKLEIEVAQNAMQKVTDHAKPADVGAGSGDSPLSFVSMLKAINSRSCASFA